MSNINTATYIKKLVKMVYEKENQIQGLKKQLRNINSGGCAGPCREGEEKSPMEETIKHELYLTSTQLREVTLQMNVMETKMVDLQIGLEEEIIKNNELETEIAALKQENSKVVQEKMKLKEQLEHYIKEKQSYAESFLKSKKEFDEISMQVKTLFESFQAIKSTQKALRQEKSQLAKQIKEIRQRETKTNLLKIDIEKQFTLLMAQLLQKNNQISMMQMDLQRNSKNLEAKKQQVQSSHLKIAQLNQELNVVKESHSKLSVELQTKSNELILKLGENHHLSESLKNYQEFSFEISKYIQSAFLRHCCQGHLRSSKKLIKEAEKGHSMFESSFRKMTQIQNWMDDTAEKLEKIIEQQEIPNQTLENLSIIVRSFEEKLDLCDLTERLEKENDQFIKNEEEVIKNLQKDCQKSYQRQYSRIVELGEMKEVLKMTKEVNRELLDQVNQRDCIISECKKLFQKCLPKNSQEFNLMKRVLGQI